MSIFSQHFPYLSDKKNDMLKILLTFLFIFAQSLVPTAATAEWGQKPVAKLKEEARNTLLERKVGFDAYMKKKQEWEKRRLAQANKMKSIRQAQAEKKEKARKNFVRTTRAFPHQAYVTFLRNREKRRQELKKAQKEFVAVQDELEKIFEDKRYKINGKKEFDL